jgi:ribosomal protein S18 acetylase RimI-like enzyme
MLGCFSVDDLWNRFMLLVEDSSYERILKYLLKMDDSFIPKLSEVVDIKGYSIKLSKKAIVYFAFFEECDIGMLAFYSNEETKISFITSISVMPEHHLKGIGRAFLEKAEEISKTKGMNTISLEVNKKNEIAQFFYEKNNFQKKNEKENSWIFQKRIK